MGKCVAQWGAGDLHQPIERLMHLQDQEDCGVTRLLDFQVQTNSVHATAGAISKLDMNQLGIEY
jgi:hypothetical protein